MSSIETDSLLSIDIAGYETLFLDRDGIINVWRPNDYVKCWDEFEFTSEILTALKIWSKHFKYIIVITNQRGVGRGIMSEQDLINIHDRMVAEIEKAGGRIDKIYYCTATSSDDINRKPNIGMGLKAKMDYPDIDFDKAMMIGDSKSDMEFASTLKVKGILFQSNYIVLLP